MTGASALECSVAAEFEIPHILLDEPVKLLDMDRTTLRAQDCVEETLALADNFGLSAQTISGIREEQCRVEGDGGSFDLLQHIQGALSEDRFDAFGDMLLHAKTDLAYDDVDPLFAALRATSPVPHFYGTYGENPFWQAVKVPHSHFSGWTVIMPNSNKGALAESLRGPAGGFDFFGIDENGKPQAVYHCLAGIELTDDKAKSHKNLPEDCTGKMLWRPDEPRLPSQGIEVPEGVRNRVEIIHSLTELSVKHAMRLASCSTVEWDAALQPAAFRSVHENENSYPGLYIDGALSFQALRLAVGRLSKPSPAMR